MTTTNFSTTTKSPHIEALESVFSKASKPVEWLVIAHNDAQMLRSLSSALTGESAAVLEVSQDNWNFQDKQLPEAIEWTLQRGEIRNLVLVGNSHAGGSECRASMFASEATNGNQFDYAKLIAGVEHDNTRNRDAQKRFAAHVQQMLRIPVVHNHWSNGELQVYGLFYRAENGLFLAYNVDVDAFRPLVP